MKTTTDIAAIFDDFNVKDGASISFHHHLRNGDAVQNHVLDEARRRKLKNLRLYPSAVFPVHRVLKTLLEEGAVASLTTNYLNGPVAEYFAKEASGDILRMQSHGGRARAVIEGDNPIDIAFVAAPAVDAQKNASGLEGPAACGSLGYAMEDVKHAKHVVLVTDTLVDHLENPQIDGTDVDAVLVLDSIGDPKGITSGTLSLTRDPIGMKIARSAMRLLDALGVIKEGFSFQSGAGGVSLRVVDMLNEKMTRDRIHASFFSGGITGHHVKMLEAGLVETLYDVQCFDLEAIASLRRNASHIAISADRYANPNNPDRVIADLDCVILGATEIDLDFNVNVTTDSHNTIIGGSGGHSDTAEDAKLSLIVTPLIKGRIPVIKERVTTITTPGKTVDVLITERGIAINPARQGIIETAQKAGLHVDTIEGLMAIAHTLTGVPASTARKTHPIGFVESRRGERLDTLHAKE